MNSASLLLHPVRLRIVEIFLGDRALTTTQIASELADIPIGSLYRHIAILVKAGVLQVVAERRRRGAIERTYVLRPARAQVSASDAQAMSHDEQQHAFLAFIANLITEADRYFGSEDSDPVRDGIGYRMSGLWLSDQELHEFYGDLVALLGPRLANLPGEGRKRRIFSWIALLAPEERRGGERG